jgi:hypothetical protein
MKTSSRFVLLGILILVCITSIFAQTATRDVVYLKNGSVIHGMIIETIPNVSIKIQTSDGNIFVYNFSDIEKYGKESVPGTEAANPPMAPMAPAMNTSPSFSIFGGASLPMGDFASTSSGAAKTGFAGGVQFVTGGQVGLLISAFYSSNPLDESAVSGASSVGNWQNIMALLGLKIGTANASGANFFVAPLIGVNFGKSPEISFNESTYLTDVFYNGYDYSGYMPISGTVTAQATSATVFAYGAMMEIELGHFIFGARYITCKPHFDVTVSGVLSGSATMYNSYYGYQSFNYSNTINSSMGMDQTVSVIIAYLGVAF